MARVPPGLVLGFSLQIVITLARLLLVATDHAGWMMNPRWGLLSRGIAFAILGLLATGAFDLANRVGGARAQAARIAGYAALGLVVLKLGYIAMNYILVTDHDASLKDLESVLGYGWTALVITQVGAVSYALGGWDRSRPLAVTAVVFAALSVAPGFIGEAIYDLAGKVPVFQLAVFGFVVPLLILLASSARELAVPAEDKIAAETGMDRIADALWLRVIAAGVLTLITLTALGGRGGGISMMQLVMVASPLVNALALTLLAVAAFKVGRSGVPALSGYAIHVAGALTVWAGSVVVTQLPWWYVLSYKRETGFGGELATGIVETFATMIPLVAATGLVCVTVAINRFARARGLDDLRGVVSMRAGMFVMLILGSVALQALAVPRAESKGTFVALTLFAAVAGLAAIIVIAKLCTLAARAVQQSPGLPTATVVSSDHSS